MSIENSANQVIKAHTQVMSKHVSIDDCKKTRENYFQEAIKLYHQDAIDVLKIAANTIYFADSSNYDSALWEIIEILAPGTSQQLRDKTYEYMD